MPLWDSLRSCGEFGDEFGGVCVCFLFFSLSFFTFFFGGGEG